MVTGRTAYYMGKPNLLMMRTGLKLLGTKIEETAIIGDRMDTDIISGVEAEIETILVLSGVTTLDIAAQYPYRPTYILKGVGDLVKS